MLYDYFETEKYYKYTSGQRTVIHFIKDIDSYYDEGEDEDRWFLIADILSNCVNDKEVTIALELNEKIPDYDLYDYESYIECNKSEWDKFKKEFGMLLDRV